MSQILECEKCGNGLVGGDLLCKLCGHLSGRVCRGCGRYVPIGKRLCEGCGNDLGPELTFGVGNLPQIQTVSSVSPDRNPQPITVHIPAAPAATQISSSPAVTRILADASGTAPRQTSAPVADARPLQVPPIPGSSDQATNGGSYGQREPVKIDHTDYPLILETCHELLRARTDLYGVFGRPASGKTCFIYALGRLLKGWPGAKVNVGNYALDRNWEDLIHYQESMFEAGIEKPTARGLHFYNAKAIGRGKSKRHFALIDIPGEQFEQIDDWTRDITHFFMTYLTHCKGLFLFLELDPESVCKNAADVVDSRARIKGAPLSDAEAASARQAWRFKREQLSHMVKFLSAAATINKVSSLDDLEQQKGALMDGYRAERFGAHTVKVPVVLCITKADLIKDYRFDGYPAIVPGSGDFLGDPWNVIETFFPHELENLKLLVPGLKIEWTSSTGDSFNPKRGVGQPLGLASVFDHVIGNPPPKWALSARTYQRFARLFGLGV